MASEEKQSNITRQTISMDPKAKEELMKLAERNRRSLSAEIMFRLSASLERDGIQLTH